MGIATGCSRRRHVKRFPHVPISARLIREAFLTEVPDIHKLDQGHYVRPTLSL
jgi:hypothetical protein